MTAWKYDGVRLILASASFVNARLAGLSRVGAQISAPTWPMTSSPMPCSEDWSVKTPVPISGTLPASALSPYCLAKRTACPATKTCTTASTSRGTCVRYGAKSMVFSGAQIFCTTRPPASSNTRWKPPTPSWPKLLSMAIAATRRYLSVRAA